MEDVISVLHVDDEPSFLDLTQKYMQLIGDEKLKFYPISDPTKVFTKLKVRNIDVIVTDYQMPIMNGLELLNKLRESNNNIPVIILTGRGREEVAIRALNLGANYYMEKGGDMKTLFSELRHNLLQLVKHRRMEKALRESEERYRIIFDESPISLWEEDFSEVKVYFDHLKSKGIQDLRQYLDSNPDEVEKISSMVKIINVNNTTIKMYNAKDKAEFFEGLPTFFNAEATATFKDELIALFNGKTVYQNEFPGYKFTGEKIDVIVRLSVIPGYEKTLEKIIISVIDITRLKIVEKTLRRQKQELSEFAHFIAHDISNCLFTIEGYTQLLDLEYDEASIIKRQVEYMKSLLTRSLTLADAGLVVELNNMVNLNDLVQSVAKMVIPKNISFIHDQLPEVLGDVEKLFQVFKNLFENALIHGKPKKIELKLLEDYDYNHILVINDGEPIPITFQEKIFDYGFTTISKNMGLGLSIVKKIIEAHGWYISVHSSQQKTYFQISIPSKRKSSS
ncbi:MAG: response regulator [Candidatus Hodarchaeales archaeon]|jgi:signal transduction histidine kinase/DNA-binding response OmpR family regulator